MAQNTIKLKNYGNNFDEGRANAAITPGMLIEQMSTGNWRAHATAGGNAARTFAIENEIVGRDIDTAYAAGDLVQIWNCQPGDQVYAILVDGENAAIGSLLESNGDGRLKVHVPDTESFDSNEPGSITVYPEQIVGIAIEAVDISDSSGAESSGDLGYNKRIKIRIV